MKLYRNIIIVTVILAILCGAWVLVSRLNPAESEPTPSEEPSSDMIKVYQANSADVVKLHIKNAQEEYTLERRNDTWLLNGDASIRITQTSVASVVHACTSVSVKQTISETRDAAENFGFANPVGFARIIFKDGSVKTITVGSPSLDNENYYIMLSDDPKIYLKNAYGTESMIPDSLSLRNLLLLELDSNNLSNLKHFYMQKQGNTSVKLEYVNTDSSDKSKMQWKMIAPVYAQMNGQVFADSIIGKLESFRAVAVIEDHPKNLSIYGLDKPHASFSVGTDEGVYSFEIGNEVKNYRYIKEDGYDTVYIIDKTNLTFLDTAYMDLMSNLIHVEYITDIDRVEVLTADKIYNMQIKRDNEKETYWINDKQIEQEPFSRAYQAVIGISLDSLDLTKEPAISPEMQIEYYKTDGTVVTVDFLPVDERNYRVTVDGKGNCITSKKNFVAVVDKITSTISQAK